ncbi:STAS domain-containing protein [Brachyspira alvinipulli]|uniref:STAS domain-containing protein n=1 Tax=Brachyspira alvinipulli TaxID=84379 RepID=UPI00048874ED|nr:STAS domain-containing protein [Brachyspira alvinipulli]
MDISVKELENNVVILKLDGDIDVYTSSDLKDAIFMQMDLGAKKIIVDMEYVYYIDSSGIGVFISALGSFKKVNGKICIVKITDPVKKVFELTKITSFFPIFTSETEALENF